MSTHIFMFLHHFSLTKLATSSSRDDSFAMIDVINRVTNHVKNAIWKSISAFSFEKANKKQAAPKHKEHNG